MFSLYVHTTPLFLLFFNQDHVSGPRRLNVNFQRNKCFIFKRVMNNHNDNVFYEE
jgi:hypothetical protein